MKKIDQIKDDVRNILSEFRYNHSLMVAEEAKNLAKNYGYDEEKAYLTGVLHDIAKELSDEENKEIINSNNLDKELLNKNIKEIIHADVGAIIAKEKYNIDDEIYNAIKYHAIGQINMSILDKIIFVADKIAREEKTPLIEEASKVAYKSLDDAILLILESQQKRLENKGKSMHKNSLELMKKLKKQEVKKGAN